MTVSADGKVAYGELGGSILGYNIATGTLVFNRAIPGSPDGTGVISGGSLNGDLIVNNNDGSIGLINPITNTYSVIATGGSRGDFVGADLTNGTLFIASADGMERLALAGASIGGGGTSVPEPALLTLLCTGLLGLGLSRRWRKA